MPDKTKEETQEEDVKKTELDTEKTENEIPEYSNITTADGKKLKNIDGGYTISGLGADPDENDFTAV